MCKNELILMGVISVAHGVRGHVVIKSFTDFPKNIVKLKLIDKNNTSINLKFIRYNSKKNLICQISGITNRHDAEKMVKTALYCKRADLPDLKRDEFYINDLKGIKVVNSDHQDVGTVTDILNFGAGDVIEVKFHHNNNKKLFPFTKESFPNISDHWLEIRQSHLIDEQII